MYMKGENEMIPSMIKKLFKKEKIEIHTYPDAHCENGISYINAVDRYYDTIDRLLEKYWSDEWEEKLSTLCKQYAEKGKR